MIVKRTPIGFSFFLERRRKKYPVCVANYSCGIAELFVDTKAGVGSWRLGENASLAGYSFRWVHLRNWSAIRTRKTGSCPGLARLARSISNVVYVLQRGVRHGHRAECGDQEALQTFPKRHAREEGLQGVQAYEAGQPQKRESLLFLLLVAPGLSSDSTTILCACSRR